MSKTGELASVVEDLSVIGKTLAAVGEDLIRTAVRVKACFPEDCLAGETWHTEDCLFLLPAAEFPCIIPPNDALTRC